MQRPLSAVCSGDHLARTGLDLKPREPPTLSMLASPGGCEPQLAEDLRRGTLRLVPELHAVAVPGFFPYFPSRARASPALGAFVDVARESAATPLPAPSPSIREASSAGSRAPSTRTVPSPH